MSESVLDCARDEIVFRLHRGEQLGAVESEVIEPTPRLSEDERAALWLFAWTYPPQATSDTDRLKGCVAG